MINNKSKLKLLKAVTLPVVLSVCLTSCARTNKVIGAHETQWKQKELFITYSCSAPPSEERIQSAAAESFNVIPASEEALDFASKHNIKVMLEHGRLTPRIADSPTKLEELAQVIDRVKNHPALECYYLFDEPVAKDIPKVAKLVSFIREKDPEHFCFVNMLPVHGVPGYAVPIEPGVDPSKTYSKFLKNYIETVKPDLLSYDFYNFLRTPDGAPKEQGGYFANLSLIRDAAKSARIPFINIIQASTMLSNWRRPTASELRWQVYTTLAYGGRGISYFLYWGPKKYGGMYEDGLPNDTLLLPIRQLNKEMKVLSTTLMTLDSEQVFNTDPSANTKISIPPSSPVQLESRGKIVLGLFSHEGKIDHFMLVNSDYQKPVSTKIRISGNLSELDRNAGHWKMVDREERGVYELTINAGDGRLFRFEQQ